MTHNGRMVGLHEAWWRRENSLPLVSNFVPLKMPYGGLDIDVPVSQIGERKVANGAAMTCGAQDRLVVQRVDFGPAFLPALAGAALHYDGVTSWNTPVADTCANARVCPFNADHPLWAAYAQRRERLLRYWSWDGFLPGHLSNVGPFDILAGLLGPENLAIQMVDDPAGVADLAAAAADLFAAAMRDDVAAFRAAGLADGMTDAFSVWMPGRGIRMVEDFSVLVGPAHTRQFLLPADRRATGGFDRVLFHTHSAAFRNLPILTQLEVPLAVEFGTDPTGPDLAQRIEVARTFQESHLPVQFGAWQCPLTDAEIKQVVRELDPRGLFLRFQAASVEDSCRIRDLVLGLAGRN